MKCPACGKEMESGTMNYTGAWCLGSVWWQKERSTETVRLHVYGDVNYPLGDKENCKGYYCPDCEMLILPKGSHDYRAK